MTSLNRRPAKKGSREHNKRISDGLIEYHKRNGKPKKKGVFAAAIARHFHPDNVRHRKIMGDKEVKRTGKEARQAEGKVAEGRTKLTSEQKDAVRKALHNAIAKHEKAIREASKRHTGN